MLSRKALLVQVARSMRNAVIDIRYGGILFDRLNTDYGALSYMFANHIKDDDVLVDIGCGKGRVINWWLSHRPCNRIIGIELDEEIANKTRRRLRGYKNVTIITGDAIQNIPADGTLFFLFNPFPAQAVEAFKNRLMNLFSERGGVTIFYYNCKHVGVFQKDPLWSVEIFDVVSSSPLPFSRCAIIRIQSKFVPNLSLSDDKFSVR